MLNQLKNLILFATTRTGRTIAQLEHENAELRAMLAERVMDETKLINFYMSQDEATLDIGFRGGAAKIMAEMFAKAFKDAGAENFLEWRFASSHIMPDEQFTVTMQRVRGKSPAQLLAEAKNCGEREVARELLDLLKLPLGVASVGMAENGWLLYLYPPAHHLADANIPAHWHGRPVIVNRSEYPVAA